MAANGSRIEVIAGTGQLGSELVENDPKATQLNFPGGVAVAADGSILITDTRNCRVLRVVGPSGGGKGYLPERGDEGYLEVFEEFRSVDLDDPEVLKDVREELLKRSGWWEEIMRAGELLRQKEKEFTTNE